MVMEGLDIKKTPHMIACKSKSKIHISSIDCRDSHVGAAAPTTPETLIDQLNSPGRYNI